MTEPILIVGTRALAKAMGVGRQQIIDWLADGQCRFPATRAHKHAPWISTRQNLTDWSNARFAPKGAEAARQKPRPDRRRLNSRREAAAPGPPAAAKRPPARRPGNDSVDTKPKM